MDRLQALTWSISIVTHFLSLWFYWKSLVDFGDLVGAESGDWQDMDSAYGGHLTSWSGPQKFWMGFSQIFCPAYGRDSPRLHGWYCCKLGNRCCPPWTRSRTQRSYCESLKRVDSSLVITTSLSKSLSCLATTEYGWLVSPQSGFSYLFLSCPCCDIKPLRFNGRIFSQRVSTNHLIGSLGTRLCGSGLWVQLHGFTPTNRRMVLRMQMSMTATSKSRSVCQWYSSPQMRIRSHNVWREISWSCLKLQTFFSALAIIATVS